MKTIDKIISKVDTKYGAPHGRKDVGEKPEGIKIYDCKVPMDSSGCYDKGGAYWGLALSGEGELRVSYTKDLTYIHFYRK